MDFFAAHPVHPWLFLFCMACFPRLTMLFAVATPFGFLHWLGWFFAPHLLAAIMATYMYWRTNPVLCVIAWSCALGGTSTEAGYANRARS